MVEATPAARRATALADRDRDLLDFEREWWSHASSKEEGIRSRFSMSATRYYQVLNALLNTPEAMDYDPLLVKRLRRLRDTRQRARSARRLGADPNQIG